MGRRPLTARAAAVDSGLTRAREAARCVHACPPLDIVPYLHMSNLRFREGNSLVQGHTARTHSYSNLEKSRLGLTLKSWHLRGSHV